MPQQPLPGSIRMATGTSAWMNSARLGPRAALATVAIANIAAAQEDPAAKTAASAAVPVAPAGTAEMPVALKAMAVDLAWMHLPPSE